MYFPPYESKLIASINTNFAIINVILGANISTKEVTSPRPVLPEPVTVTEHIYKLAKIHKSIIPNASFTFMPRQTRYIKNMH